MPSCLIHSYGIVVVIVIVIQFILKIFKKFDHFSNLTASLASN